MLIAMAGLPGTGKSTIARRLAAELGGVVLDKDVVRIALFPPPALDYSTEQDELTMAAIYQAAERIVSVTPNIPVILDGRTYRLQQQVRDLFALAKSLGTEPKVIECISSDDVVRARLEADAAKGNHPAGNRSFELYLKVKSTAEPLTMPRLTLDTGAMSIEECVAACLRFIARE